MKKSTMALLICVVFIFATAVASFAAMGEGSVGTSKGVDITLFGSNRVIPMYQKNLNDFNDDIADKTTLNEGGWGAGFFVRNEFRMGWKGVGQDGKWGFKFILENDIHMTKKNGDRNNYGNGPDQPFASAFSVERQTFWYKFGDVRFSAGTDIQFLDIKTGGLVYGDDHPFLALNGGNKDLNWKLFMLLIEDSDTQVVKTGYRDLDWYAYCGKLNYTFDTGDMGKFTLTPFVAYSDMRKGAQGYGNSQAYYYGLGGHGAIGIIKPSFEVVGVTGTINGADPDTPGNDIDIQSYAAFGAITLAVSPEFNPYIGAYWVQGDDKTGDGDADGFVGITNITRYTPTFGMEGGIMYEHLYAFGAPLYGLTPERKGRAQYRYGGIGGAGSGENPGLQYYGLGSKGKFQGNNSYKIQVAYMMYDEEGTLKDKNGIVGNVDDEIGWVFDGQIKHTFSKNFYTTFTFSCLNPGDGIQDQFGQDDLAINSNIELGWKW